MTTDTLALPQSAFRSQTLRALLPPLAVAAVALMLLFHAEAAAALATWIDSTAYNHCFFVLPIALWLAWERRATAAGLAARPTAWPALAVLPLGLAWFAAERLGIMEGRQLAAIFMLQALLVALLGWRLARVYAAPIAYLVFLVPFGAFLTHPLQIFTARFVDIGLAVIGIPHVVTEFLIEIPEGRFFVAEACAGLRFLIAAVAFGALYVLLLYRSPLRRIVFMAACLTVPVIANGFRALGIVVLGHVLGSAQAAEADHIIYGWGFFSAVILLLTVAGLPFRQDRAPPTPAQQPVPAAAPAWTRAVGVAVAVTLVAAIAPSSAAVLARSGHLAPPRLPGFATPAGCQRQTPATAPVQTFTCGAFRVTAGRTVISSHAGGGAIKRMLRIGSEEQGDEQTVHSTLAVPGQAARAWELTATKHPPRLVATLLLNHGTPVSFDGLANRVATAWSNLTRPATPLVLTTVSVEPTAAEMAPDRPRQAAERMQAARRELAAFLAAQPAGNESGTGKN